MSLKPQISSLQLLWLAVILLSLLVLAIGLKRYYPTSNPAALVEQRMEPVPACDLHNQACTLAVPGVGAVTLSVSPRPIPLIQPLSLQVSIEGMPAERVSVDFSGVDMDMGFNRFALQRSADGHYTGQGMLPICTRSRMTWEAQVLVDANGVRRIFPFRFDTQGR